VKDTVLTDSEFPTSFVTKIADIARKCKGVVQCFLKYNFHLSVTNAGLAIQ
jgi:hypothetical protein